MTNTKLFLLFGTSLSLIPTITSAQCVATQDCATLGYTETSCSGGNGVKCPFGNKWACFQTRAEIEKEICTDLGYTLTCTGTGETGSGESCANLYKQCGCQDTYKHTCTGTGYAGGVGTACGGKYTECKCANGYIWNDSSQKCEDTCVIGALYYSDGTCSRDKISSKTLLGVVIYEKSASKNGWIMTVKPIKTAIEWGGYGTDIPGLSNITSESKLTDVQSSCTNTDVITAYGSSSTYPAAWAAKNYKPSGTPSGKSWCLPSGGLLNDSLDNSTNLARINAGITTAGGKKIGFGISSSYETVWSSSEYNHATAWRFTAGTDGSFTMYNLAKSNYLGNGTSVRPVLAF